MYAGKNSVGIEVDQHERDTFDGRVIAFAAAEKYFSQDHLHQYLVLKS